MANVIKHKRGSGSDPAANNLVIGELAIRTDTGKLFTKMDSGAIAEIAGGGSDIAINTLSSSSGTGGGSATFNGSAYRFTLSAPPSVSAAQLLVSINGVIQKPVTGTGQPSEGFAVDGTDIILGDAPATGSDFFILTFKSLGVSEPADNSVTSAKIVDGAIVNADVNASAAIAGSKIDPTFTSTVNVTNTLPEIFLTDTNTSNARGRLNANAGGLLLGADNDNAAAGSVISFAVDGTEKARIDSSGNLGIGTTSPGENLHINSASGSARIRMTSADGSDNMIVFGDQSDTATGAVKFDHSDNSLALFGFNNTERMRIDSSGRLLLGTTTEGYTSADDFTVATTGHTGITIRSGTTSLGTLAFSDGTSGSAEFDGYIQYDQDNRHMDFATGGGNIRARIASDGKVGIGTTSPSNIIHATGSNSGTGYQFINTHATDGFGVRIAGGGTTADRYALRVDDAAANERFRVNANGNVGIGTSIPSTPLHVSTNTDGTSDLITLHADADGTGANNGIASIKFMGNSNHAAFIKGGHTTFGDTILTFHTDAHDSGINPEERMRIDSSGQVGIGTTSPSSILHVNSGTDNICGLFESTDTEAQIRIKDSGSSIGIIAVTDGAFAFENTGTGSLVKILNNGRVGIGTTGPDDKLVLSGSTGDGLKLIDGTHTVVFRTFSGGGILKTASNHRLAFGTNDAERFTISTKGAINTLFNDTDSVGVVHKRTSGSNNHNFFEIRSNGSTPLSGGTLQFAIETDGDVKNTNNSYGSLSDIKLKENIVDAKSQWDDIKALKIRNYNFKSELDYGTYTQIGLIAQEVEETSPGLVVDNIDRDDEGKDLGTVTKALRYSVLHIKALKALQEAMAKIETLETKVAALEAK